MANRYSVYRLENEMPVAIYATADECAAAMGIKKDSFYKYIHRMRLGRFKHKKWLICKDDQEEVSKDNE